MIKHGAALGTYCAAHPKDSIVTAAASTREGE
jgi:hypothetical protein